MLIFQFVMTFNEDFLRRFVCQDSTTNIHISNEKDITLVRSFL